MKNTLLHSIVLPFSALALTASVAVHAGQETTNPNANVPNSAAHHQSAADKRDAAEFWADFKQDSKQTWKDSKSAFKDGWIESKLETALILNEHLNPFAIDIRVDNNTATLEGEVHSSIDKELAENIALGIEGIDDVENKIKVVAKSSNMAQPTEKTQRSFAQYVSDATMTAAIKTELLASSNVKGLKVDVDTHNDEVTLSGEVKTAEEKELVQAIVAKHDDVKKVINNLEVKS
jgi:osmotically-inducible protein OsmY